MTQTENDLGKTSMHCHPISGPTGGTRMPTLNSLKEESKEMQQADLTF